MQSLDAIAEPTHNAPSVDPTDVPQHVPLAVAVSESIGRPGVATSTSEKPDPENEQVVDNLAVLLVLLIAGALLRVVLGMLGPLQGIDRAYVELAEQGGRDVFAGDSINPYPLTEVLALGVGSVGLPAWGLVVIGSLLSIAAIPGAYVVGHVLTGRRLAGIVAAAVVAVHPAALTAANTYSGLAIALGLLTIGLAVVCNIEKRGFVAASAGGLMLGLAGLAAPLCWLIGALAGPLAYKLARRSGMCRAIGAGLMVAVLAVAPAIAYRSAYLGHDAKSFFVEWSPMTAAELLPGPLDRLLVSMTSPSFQSLGEAMHLPINDAGRLQVHYEAQPAPSVERDVVADMLADGWLLMNAAMAGLAAISAGVMIARRRFAETLLLAVPMLALAFTTLPPSEALRLPMLAMVGVLALGLFATRSERYIDEEQREAKRIAKEAKREEKERIKQERELKKHKESLYAFDEPSKVKRVSEEETNRIDARPI